MSLKKQLESGFADYLNTAKQWTAWAGDGASHYAAETSPELMREYGANVVFAVYRDWEKEGSYGYKMEEWNGLTDKAYGEEIFRQQIDVEPVRNAYSTEFTYVTWWVKYSEDATAMGSSAGIAAAIEDAWDGTVAFWVKDGSTGEMKYNDETYSHIPSARWSKIFCPTGFGGEIKWSACLYEHTSFPWMHANASSGGWGGGWGPSQRDSMLPESERVTAAVSSDYFAPAQIAVNDGDSLIMKWWPDGHPKPQTPTS